jgi:predicted DNA-binding transcriptional regulator YafY
MVKYHGKKDRTARLIKLQMLLSQHPEGMEVQQIADECSISIRTVYRDLKTLEYSLNIPIWTNHGKYGVTEDHFLSPIVFSIEEAVNILWAIRLMQNLTYEFNPSIQSTFGKLNTIVPPQVRQKIQDTLEFMKKLPVNQHRLVIFKTLVQAWFKQQTVAFHYLEQYAQESIDCTVDIYFIEPSILGHSNYIIGFCHEMKKVYAFKESNINGDIIVTQNIYEIPKDYSAANFLGSQWDVHLNKELETIKLRFSSKVSKRVKETTWHPSQTTELKPDGSLIMTLRVRDFDYFGAWILGWGDNVEVLEPETLRNLIKSIIESLKTIYDN